MTNHWFRQNDSIVEQRLIENLITEAIEIYGINTWYIRRNTLNQDNIIVDEKYASFDAAYPLTAFVKTNEGFEGEGDFLSKFGLEIRDRMILSISRTTFNKSVAVKSPNTIRPFEGDLIYFPLNRKLFEIKFVEHEPVFYQMGALQAYDVTCELFEYNNETFATGVTEIDNIYKYKLNSDLDDVTYVPDSYDQETNDPLAINTVVQQESNSIFAWDETDPFSEGSNVP